MSSAGSVVTEGPYTYTVWLHFPTEAAAELAVDELRQMGHLAVSDPPQAQWTVCAWTAEGEPWPRFPWPTYETEDAAQRAVAEAEQRRAEVKLFPPDDTTEWLVRAAMVRDWDVEVNDWWIRFEAVAASYGGVCDGGEGLLT